MRIEILIPDPERCSRFPLQTIVENGDVDIYELAIGLVLKMEFQLANT